MLTLHPAQKKDQGDEAFATFYSVTHDDAVLNPTPFSYSTPKLLDSDYGGMPDPISTISLPVQSSVQHHSVTQHHYCWTLIMVVCLLIPCKA